ncbi:MAG: YqaJ viral recombinase family protein [Rhodocyclaceae bacterium]
MIIHDVIQGSPEWLALRATTRNASEAAAMMGDDDNVTRNELIHMKATGTEKEFSDFVREKVLDKGHRLEALARPIIEKRIGQKLSTDVATDDDGYLLASTDGADLMFETGFEHKQWNEKLAQAVRDNDLPPKAYWQLEQQILVFGFEKVVFVVSDGTEENMVTTEYRAVPGRAEKLLAGWRQFDEDVANYVPPEYIEKAVAAPIKELPTLFVQARGEVTKTNMPEFKAQITEFLAAINMQPATDQEFADGKAVAVKLRELAVKIKERKDDMLAQTVTIGEVAKEIDLLAATINSSALELEKAVKREEDARKLAIVNGGKTALAEHVAKLNDRLGSAYMPIVAADFTEAIKGKRNTDSMQNAVDTLLANTKILASETADRIEANIKSLTADQDWGFLFPDLKAVCVKATDDFAALLAARVATHKAAEQKRLDAEREKIRAEEAAKLKAETDAKAAAEAKTLAEAQSRAQKEVAEKAAAEEQLAADRLALQGAVRSIPSSAGINLSRATVAARAAIEHAAQGSPSVVGVAPNTHDLMHALCALLDRMNEAEMKLVLHYCERIEAERQSHAAA